MHNLRSSSSLFLKQVDAAAPQALFSQVHYRVERPNAWMDSYRVLLIRCERKAAHYLAYCTLAAILCYLKRLV